ncbi:hypothetical protein V8C86DRAFT_2558768 [Haematococcus lacustris]
MLGTGHIPSSPSLAPADSSLSGIFRDSFQDSGHVCTRPSSLELPVTPAGEAPAAPSLHHLLQRHSSLEAAANAQVEQALALSWAAHYSPGSSTHPTALGAAPAAPPPTIVVGSSAWQGEHSSLPVRPASAVSVVSGDLGGGPAWPQAHSCSGGDVFNAPESRVHAGRFKGEKSGSIATSFSPPHHPGSLSVDTVCSDDQLVQTAKAWLHAKGCRADNETPAYETLDSDRPTPVLPPLVGLLPINLQAGVGAWQGTGTVRIVGTSSAAGLPPPPSPPHFNPGVQTVSLAAAQDPASTACSHAGLSAPAQPPASPATASTNAAWQPAEQLSSHVELGMAAVGGAPWHSAGGASSGCETEFRDSKMRGGLALGCTASFERSSTLTMQRLPSSSPGLAGWELDTAHSGADAPYSGLLTMDAGLPLLMAAESCCSLAPSHPSSQHLDLLLSPLLPTVAMTCAPSSVLEGCAEGKMRGGVRPGSSRLGSADAVSEPKDQRLRRGLSLRRLPSTATMTAAGSMELNSPSMQAQCSMASGAPSPFCTLPLAKGSSQSLGPLLVNTMLGSWSPPASSSLAASVPASRPPAATATAGSLLELQHLQQREVEDRYQDEQGVQPPALVSMLSSSPDVFGDLDRQCSGTTASPACAPYPAPAASTTGGSALTPAAPQQVNVQPVGMGVGGGSGAIAATLQRSVSRAASGTPFAVGSYQATLTQGVLGTSSPPPPSPPEEPAATSPPTHAACSNPHAALLAEAGNPLLSLMPAEPLQALGQRKLRPLPPPTSLARATSLPPMAQPSAQTRPGIEPAGEMSTVEHCLDAWVAAQQGAWLAALAAAPADSPATSPYTTAPLRHASLGGAAWPQLLPQLSPSPTRRHSPLQRSEPALARLQSGLQQAGIGQGGDQGRLSSASHTPSATSSHPNVAALNAQAGGAAPAAAPEGPGSGSVVSDQGQGRGLGAWSVLSAASSSSCTSLYPTPWAMLSPVRTAGLPGEEGDELTATAAAVAAASSLMVRTPSLGLLFKVRPRGGSTWGGSLVASPAAAAAPGMFHSLGTLPSLPMSPSLGDASCLLSGPAHQGQARPKDAYLAATAESASVGGGGKHTTETLSPGADHLSGAAQETVVSSGHEAEGGALQAVAVRRSGSPGGSDRSGGQASQCLSGHSSATAFHGLQDVSPSSSRGSSGSGSSRNALLTGMPTPLCSRDSQHPASTQPAQRMAACPVAPLAASSPVGTGASSTSLPGPSPLPTLAQGHHQPPGFGGGHNPDSPADLAASPLDSPPAPFPAAGSETRSRPGQAHTSPGVHASGDGRGRASSGGGSLATEEPEPSPSSGSPAAGLSSSRGVASRLARTSSAVSQHGSLLQYAEEMARLSNAEVAPCLEPPHCQQLQQHMQQAQAGADAQGEGHSCASRAASAGGANNRGVTGMPRPASSQGVAASSSFRFDTPSADIQAALSATATNTTCPAGSQHAAAGAGQVLAAPSCRSIHQSEALLADQGLGLGLTPSALGPVLSDGLAAAWLVGMGTSIHSRLAVGQALLAAAGGSSDGVTEAARPPPGAAPVVDDPDLPRPVERGRDSAAAALVAAQGGQGCVKQAGAVAEGREEWATVTPCHVPHASSNLPYLAPSSQYYCSWSVGGSDSASTDGHQPPSNLAVPQARGQGGQLAQGLAAGCPISISSPHASAKPSLAATLAPLPWDCCQVQV